MTVVDVPLDRVDAVLLRESLYRLSVLEESDDATRAALARAGLAICDALDDTTDRQFEFRVRVHLSGSDVRDETSPWGTIRTAGSSLPFTFPVEQLSRRQRWAIALSRTGFLAVEISAGEVAR